MSTKKTTKHEPENALADALGPEGAEGLEIAMKDLLYRKHHFRASVNGKILPEYCPSVDNARRVMADALKGGGVGRIYECVELWSDEGATLSLEEMEAWE